MATDGLSRLSGRADSNSGRAVRLSLVWSLGAALLIGIALSGIVTGVIGDDHVQPVLLVALAVDGLIVALCLRAVMAASAAPAAAEERLVLAALDALPVAHLILGPDGTRQWVNRKAIGLFGEVDRPLQILRERLVGGDDRQILDAMLRDAAASRSGSAVLQALSPVGAAEPVTVSALPLLLQPGASLWRVGSASDREFGGPRPWSDYLDDLPVGLYALDDKGAFIALNRRLAQWLESTPDRLVGDHLEFEEFVIPGKPPAGRAGYAAATEGDWSEITLRGRLGGLKRISITQRKGQSGGTAMLGVVHDLVADRAMDDTLRLVRQRFQHFFEAAPIGIALVDANGQVADANRALEALLTDGKGRLAGRNLFDFVTDDERAALEARIKAAGTAGAGAPSLALTLSAAGQRDKSAAVFFSRLEAEAGGAAGAVLHFIDLTEYKNLEVQLAQSQKMQAIGQLAGGIAHDFNNLLTAMIGFCDLLLLRFKAGDQSFADVMQIKQNANRAANLVRQLLAFSRQQTLQPRVLNIADVLSDLSHLLTRLLSDRVDLRTVTARDVGPVKVDQGQLEQVIINLAVNARDAMPDGGQLRIETRRAVLDRALRVQAETIPAGNWVLIDVSDQGTGIPPDILPRIFEPFFSTKPMGSGTEAGLATVYGIVKQTGGHIVVSSTMGLGTRFQIYLPEFQAGPTREDAPVLPDLAVPQATDLTGAGTILLVEDEEPVRLFSARALRNRGYRVFDADGGEAALDLVTKHGAAIDLVITDVMMPRMDGPTMIRRLRESMPKMKVIFISGYAEDTFRKKLDSDSGILFLAKPFSLKQLAEKVREAMTQPVH